jgi:hypothetical protein
VADAHQEQLPRVEPPHEGEAAGAATLGGGPCWRH